MKSKIKKKKIIQIKKQPYSSKNKKYSTYYLALILAATLLLEGVLFGITTGPNWKSAAQILDVSPGVSEVQSNLVTIFQPMIDLVSSIDQFYRLSAIQMSKLLDLSDSGIGSEAAMVYHGASEFYRQSSVQMAQMLDFSSTSPWLGSIAGISVEK